MAPIALADVSGVGRAALVTFLPAAMSSVDMTEAQVQGLGRRDQVAEGKEGPVGPPHALHRVTGG